MDRDRVRVEARLRFGRDHMGVVSGPRHRSNRAVLAGADRPGDRRETGLVLLAVARGALGPERRSPGRSQDPPRRGREPPQRTYLPGARDDQKRPRSPNRPSSSNSSCTWDRGLIVAIDHTRPWIILITDRRASGLRTVRAVATYPQNRGLRTTFTPRRVRRFKTKAEACADGCGDGVGSPEKDPHRLFSIIRD